LGWKALTYSHQALGEDGGSRIAGSNRRLDISKKANENAKIKPNQTGSGRGKGDEWREAADCQSATQQAASLRYDVCVRSPAGAPVRPNPIKSNQIQPGKMERGAKSGERESTLLYLPCITGRRQLCRSLRQRPYTVPSMAQLAQFNAQLPTPRFYSIYSFTASYDIIPPLAQSGTFIALILPVVGES